MTQEALEKARAAFASGDPQGAFGHIRPIVTYPGDDANADVLALFVELCAAISGDELAAKVRAATAEDCGAQPLFDAGYALYDAGLPEVGATFLGRANLRYPGQPAIVNELVSALERVGRHHEAVRVLEEAPPNVLAESFMSRYLLGFNRLASGDVAGAKQAAAKLAARADDRDERFMSDAVAGMLARADAVAAKDLRGWHFVMNGALLLHESPYGRDAGMNGRYAFVQDSTSRCIESAKKLLQVQAALGKSVERVIALPDRDSRVLAGAVARLAGVACVPWAKRDDGPALIVGYDFNGSEIDADGVAWVRAHRPGQLLYTQAACWTEPFPLAADAVGFLYQSNRSPWDERIMAKGTSPRDERADDALIDELAAATPEEGAMDDLPDVLAIARAGATIGGPGKPGFARGSGQRARFHAASPVTSNRFW